MTDARKVGRVTIPTDLDVVPETLEIMKRWGADAIRDCDGTDFPAELQNQNAKIYSTYYTTRKDNVWGTTSRSVGMVTRPTFLVSNICQSSFETKC